MGDQGHLPQAEALHAAGAQDVAGNHPEPSERVAEALAALATELDFEGKAAPGRERVRRDTRVAKTRARPEHPDYTMTLFNYSMFIFDQKRYKEAAEYSREILALRGKTLPESHQSIASALQTLGRVSINSATPGPGSAPCSRAWSCVASTWGPELAGGKFDRRARRALHVGEELSQGRATLLQAQAQFVRTLGETNTRTRVNTRRLVALYTVWGKPAKAAEYAAALPATK